MRVGVSSKAPLVSASLAHLIGGVVEPNAAGGLVQHRPLAHVSRIVFAIGDSRWR